jgi:hypothetical protein
MKLIYTTLCGLLLAASTVSAADDVFVTVYNSNLGVVSETRSLEFTEGINRIAFRDVPSAIDAASVRFELTGGSSDVTILEQNYAYDLINPNQMFEKYIDQAIELIDEDGNVYTGTLLASGGGAVTIQEASGRIKILSREDMRQVNFPVLPDGLITRPTLFWLYQSGISGQRDCQVSYQTGGMSWAAEYVGQLSADETVLDLSGWASITNNSGKTYEDATLKLVAGDISRADVRIRGGRVGELKMAVMPEADFQQKEFFEYHLYSLPRKATVANREIKQISLFEPTTTGVEKIYRYRPDQNQKQVEVVMRFINSQERGMGMPLPAGRVRMFKADDDGSLILLGEDRIKHTPKNEKVDVSVGFAFDIVAEERQVSRTRISQSVEEAVYEIELRNRKDEAVSVDVEKRLYGFWDIISSDVPYEKKDANTLTFTVELPANEEVIVSYTVRFNRQ